MRKSLMCCLIVLTASLLSAQTQPSPRKSTTGTSVTRSTLTPANSGKSQKSSTTQKTSGDRSSNSTPGVSTTSKTNNLSTTDRKSQTSDSGTTTRTTTARPSLGTGPGNSKTAKSVSNSGKKAPTLKPAEIVKINWLSIEQAVEKSKTEKRKIFIDVYTNWCGWCKHMDSTTFVTPAVAQYINEHYYAVKFDAEQQQDILFRDKTYRFKKEGSRGYHELAALWLNNRLSYPTVVFLDENLATIQPLAGYLDATKLEAILNYFGSDSHKSTPWETYERKYATKGK